jgi:uncharacterized protein
MELTNTFAVERSINETWEALNDIEKMALCMPGASLTSLEGDSFSGKVSLRVGPVMMTYVGEGTIAERNASDRWLSMKLKGKEAKGSGTAAAVVRATLVQETPDVTCVEVRTDVDLTGKPAQFGRGVLNEVAGVIIGKFADNLAAELSRGSRTASTTPPQPGSTDDNSAVDQPDSNNDTLNVNGVALMMLRTHRVEVLATVALFTSLIALARTRGRR